MKPVLLALALLASASTCLAASNAQILLESLFHYRVLTETKSALTSLEADETATAEINTAAQSWTTAQKQAIRQKLQDGFGDSARESFTFFTTRYTQAEANGDTNFLHNINQQLDDQRVASYKQLRQRVLQHWIRPQVDAAGAWVADVQTWLDLRNRNVRTPSLNAWIARDETPTEAANPATASLADAEAPLPDFNEEDATSGSPLDDFGALRQKRRDDKRAQAQTAMQQLAVKRKAAEDSYAAKKSAEAQREADAVRAYAQKLASVEAEAMEQRKNTWGARLQRIAVATVSGALGAVTSGAGSAAGAVVAESLYGDD